jgi:N4-gp56 family major capsid protein
MNNFITYGQTGISPRVGIYLPPKFLAHAQPWLALQKAGGAQKTPLPKNKGETIIWRRSVPFDVTTNTLVEGVTPNPQNFRMEDVTDNIEQFGAYSVITDKIQDLHEDRVLDEIAKCNGEQVGSTKELIDWQTVRGGTQVVYSGTATSRATVEDVIGINQIRASVAVLKGNHGQMITKQISAGTGYSTEPVGMSYVGFGHSDQQYDVEDLDGFVPVEKYAQSGNLLCEYEIGKVKDVRIVLTPQLQPFYGAGAASVSGVLSRDGTNADVYPLVIMAQNFWGTTELGGVGSAKIAVEPPGKATKDDPLGQRGFASWMFWYCSTRLNERWGVRTESAATNW